MMAVSGITTKTEKLFTQNERELQVGDTITCKDMDDAIAYAKAITEEGYDWACYKDIKTGKETLLIIGRRAADGR